MKTRTLITVGAISLLALSCRKPEPAGNEGGYSSEPILPATPYHYSEEVNDRQAALGRVLFYDKKLSLNNSVSCSNCHQQAKAFCDNLSVSTGLQDTKTSRNSPSLFAREGRAFWDGRATDLEDLALRPVQNHVEMKFSDLHKLCEKLSGVTYYPDLFRQAFGSPTIDSTRIKRALAAFLRSFNFSKNKFSTGGHLNASEMAGQGLFFGKAQCGQCHHVNGGFGNSGYGFTDMDFNIGLDLVYKDKGRADVTGLTEDEGKFMVPVLLNVEFTGPYMHDGRFRTLEEVVEHYNSGVKAHPNLAVELRDIDRFENMEEEDIIKELDLNRDGEIDDEEIANIPARKLELTGTEKKQLVDFLKTLSDPSIRTDERFSDPFKLN